MADQLTITAKERMASKLAMILLDDVKAIERVNKIQLGLQL
jgi:hypothetical protein